MTETAARAIETRTIDVPGARLSYDVRRNETTMEPPLMLIGSPMGAGGFVTLASHFADRTVVTYDPRGADRSTKTDPTSQSTPDEHGDDIHAVISAVGSPVDLFATSGGAVNALALVARHPDDVRILVAHEPPLAQLVDDRDAALAAAKHIRETYFRSGFGPAMAKFIMLVSSKDAVPANFADIPADPAMFHLPTEDDGSRTDALLGQNMITCTHYHPDFDALRRASTRIVMGVGVESEGQLARRGGEAVAKEMGTQAVIFPSGHAGFLGGEYGQQGEPDAFAAKLRDVLSA